MDRGNLGTSRGGSGSTVFPRISARGAYFKFGFQGGALNRGNTVCQKLRTRISTLSRPLSSGMASYRYSIICEAIEGGGGGGGILYPQGGAHKRKFTEFFRLLILARCPAVTWTIQETRTTLGWSL